MCAPIAGQLHEPADDDDDSSHSSCLWCAFCSAFSHLSTKVDATPPIDVIDTVPLWKPRRGGAQRVVGDGMRAQIGWCGAMFWNIATK